MRIVVTIIVAATVSGAMWFGFYVTHRAPAHHTAEFYVKPAP